MLTDLTVAAAFRRYTVEVKKEQSQDPHLLCPLRLSWAPASHQRLVVYTRNEIKLL